MNPLAGTWLADVGSHSLTFDSNGNYVDSVFGESRTELPVYVIVGKYSLNDSLIEFRDLRFSQLRDLSGYRTSLFLFPDYQFKRVDTTLLLTQTGFFDPVDHPSDVLNGKWEADRIIVAYDTRQTPYFVTGKERMQLEFSESKKEYTILYIDNYGATVAPDSIIDGPHPYMVDNNGIFCDICSKPFATLMDGRLTIKDGPYSYTKVK
ncbi:MAG: hypothetical protein JXR71_09780 [Bacteroidales bacterium]|nr:hypothetical protein [Bacteroidales bacterium]